MDDFTYVHLALLDERNGQWMDENGNTSLWLSQGCYISARCIVTGQKRSNSHASIVLCLCTLSSILCFIFLTNLVKVLVSVSGVVI